MLAAAERGLDRLDWLLSRIAAAVILLAMLLIATDVVMRYLFRHPIFWVYDVVSIYILNFIVYFAVSEALRSRRRVCSACGSVCCRRDWPSRCAGSLGWLSLPFSAC